MKRKATFLLVLLLLKVCTLFAQQITVSGVVTDAKDGTTLVGVSVFEKGTTHVITTDINGKYALSVREGATLVFSYVGMKTQEIPAVSKTLNVSLETDAKMLDEVVVVGYGVVRKSDLTGSVGKVDIKDIKKLTVVDGAKAIEGRIAGVNVMTNSGNPGSGTTIRIRGIGTINNSNPLYVVDGFPLADISHIASGDIESIEVLKDASATAIYGSRGANGVILVKTKTGASTGNKYEVQLNAFAGVSNVTKMIEMADATQFAEARKAIGKTDEIINFVLASKEKGNYLKGTDWQKEIFRQGSFQNYNLSISGGAENYSYNHGVNYSNANGIVKGSYIKKLMVHSNNNYTLNKHIKMGVNLNYITWEMPGENTDYYTGTIQGAMRSDPISAAIDPFTNFYGEIYYSQACTNPALSIWKNGYVRNSENRFTALVYAQFDDIFIKGLSFRSQYGQQFAFQNNKSFSPKYFITPTQKNDDQTLYERDYKGVNWTNTNYFSFNRLFNKLNINSTLGMEVQGYFGNDLWAIGYDVPENADLRYLSMHKDIVKFNLGGGAGQTRLASGFFRSNLSWDNKYLLTATFRTDGSSKFVPEKRWGYFPSFSFGWNVANEDFMKSYKNIISTLKLRAGWGVVGNESSAPYFGYVSTMAGNYLYVFNKVPVNGAIQQALANKELTWESAEQYNLGVDFGLFDQKLTGTIDYFIRNTKDMIVSTPIPIYVGKQRPSVNAGTMSNKGFEFTLNHAKRSGDFTYDVSLNLTFIKNRVTSLAGGDPILGGSAGRSGNTTKTEVGREIAYFYGYKTAGIFKTNEQLKAHVKDGVPIQPYATLGDIIYLDLNDDGKIDELDKTYLGSASPVFTGGLNISLGYKNFDFVMFFNGSYGNEIVNAMHSTLYSTRLYECNISKDLALNHWSAENPNSDLPRLSADDPNMNDDRFSDRWVEDGSYLRLKNVQLGYTLPKSLTLKASIKALRVFVSSDNLLTLTKYSGLDPELFGYYGNPFYYGVDLVNYPQPRTFTAGINITF